MPEPSEDRLYTVEEANAMLPWVVERLGIATEAGDRLTAARTDQAELEGLSRSNGHGDIDSRLSNVRTEGDSALEVLQGILEEFGKRQIPVRDVDSGLIDFPGERDGRKVWLCWRMGEPEVGYWHELNTGYANRQPL